MPAFKTTLLAEKLEDSSAGLRGRWRLTFPLIYKSDLIQEDIVVPIGFITDLESCPRLPIVFTIFGAMADRPSVVHDYLYSNPNICDRATADAVLKEACILSGIPKWRAYGIWLGVRLGGGFHYNK